MNIFIVWLKQIRANFLILAVLLVLIGVSLAYRYLEVAHNMHLFKIALLITGVVLAHVSVNLFNEYSDFRTGTARVTGRALFHIENSMLASGYTKPSTVLAIAVITLMAATFIGIYFTLTAHWTLMLFILVGGFAIVTYKDFLTGKLWGELFSGLTFGSLVVIGSYVALSASPMDRIWQLVPLSVWLVAIPPGLLTTLLLLVHQSPANDLEANRLTHYHIKTPGSSINTSFYIAGALITFGSIILLPFTESGSVWMLLALLPMPFLISSVKTILFHQENNHDLITAVKRNILSVLLTDALLSLSVFLST